MITYIEGQNCFYRYIKSKQSEMIEFEGGPLSFESLNKIPLSATSLTKILYDI